MPKIQFKTTLVQIDSWVLVILPKSASEKLPSRGLVMVDGTINDAPFQAPLEPDGKGSHWFKVEDDLLKTTKTEVGDTVSLSIAPSKEWPESEVPDDLKKALAQNKSAHDTWMDTTTKARWDWIRWIRATKNPETRKIRIEKTISKLKSGMKRPCCFNASMCTEPKVSNSGVLCDLN